MVAVADSIAIPGYTLGECLGEGGFGQVFRAHHELMGRDVAIKILHARYSADPEAIGRFVAEARAVARISHEGIVEAFEFGALSDGRQFCVMELVRGTTLRDVLRERTRLPLDEALPILRAIAEAVDAAHLAGVAHRDLKPDNVFVLDSGAVKLIDFGLAKLVDDAQAPVTATGSMFGTPLYMSPEQCRGRSDAKTDLYSFGAMAFHVLTGEPPFTGAPLELALHHLNDPPPRASSVFAELPPHVDRVLDALLAKDPDHRPAPLTAAVAALAGDVKLARRRRRVWLAVPFALAALAAGAALWMRGGRVPVDECTSRASRITAAWDPARRVALVARFATVDRPDVAATQRLVLSDFDTFAGEWVRQWDASCKAPDRAPLIHAQRQNCLDRALIDFTAITDAVWDVEPKSFSLSTNGALFAWITPLEDCDREETLRAMPAAPLPEHVAEVTQLIRGIHTARAHARTTSNGQLGGTMDRPLAELDQIITKLDALGAATAAEAAMIHAYYSLAAAGYDLRRLDATHRSLDRAIALGRKYNYDRVLVDDYHIAIRLELRIGRSITKLHELYDRADEAYERAGRPTFALDEWPGRAELSILEGDLDGALAQLTQAIARPHYPLSHTYVADESATELYARLAIYLGRTDDALMYMRAQLVKTVNAWGTDHRMVYATRLIYAKILGTTGRDREALDELSIARGIATHIEAPEALQLEEATIISADRLGLAKERDAAVARWADLRPHKDHWYELSVTMDRVGRFALAKSLRSKSQSDEARWNDAIDAVQLEEGAVALADVERTQPPKMYKDWIHAVVAVHSGNAAAAEAYLAAQGSEYRTDDGNAVGAMDGDTYLLLELHRWPDARDLSERAQLLAARVLISTSDSVSELEEEQGRALLGLGDATAARPLLDRALFEMDRYQINALDVPDTAFALAQALVASHGDAERARRVAQRAIDGYPAFRKADRDAAQAWVAKLPP